MLVLAPWAKPIPFARSWCVWEIYSTIATGANLHVALSPAERAGFEKALVDDFDSIMQALSEVDAERAEAFKQADQEKIQGLVRELGFAQVNELICARLREWLLETARRLAVEREDQMRAKERSLERALENAR